MPNDVGKSLPVRTRCTPGCALARDTSVDSMSACGCGERSSFICSMRGRTRSSAKRVCPVTLARPSTRRRGLPITFIPPAPRTGAAFAERAGVLRAGETQVFAQDLKQRLVRCEGTRLLVRVHAERKMHDFHASPLTR